MYCDLSSSEFWRSVYYLNLLLGAASEDELRTVFRLHGQTTGKVNKNILFFFKSESFVAQILSILDKFKFDNFDVCRAKFINLQGNIPRKDLQTRPIEIFMCSIKKRQGYGEAFRWLSQYL